MVDISITRFNFYQRHSCWSVNRKILAKLIQRVINLIFNIMEENQNEISVSLL